MKIIIFGGSGFIGQHFVPSLLELGHSIVVYDLQPPGDECKVGVEFVHGDIRDEQRVEMAMAGCDAVLHLAAAHHDFGIEPDTFETVNVRGAEIICRAMVKHVITEACFFSSVAVYGDVPAPLEEATEPRPTTPYGKTKLGAEKEFRDWANDGSNACLVIRPTVTFGPHNFANMFTLIRQIDLGFFLPVGRSQNIKSLSYIENLVDATVQMWLGNRPDRKRYEVFNYVDKPDLTSGEITRAIYRYLGKKCPRLSMPYWLARTLVLPLDLFIRITGKNLPISGYRIKKLTAMGTQFEASRIRDAGFEQRIATLDGIRRMVEWYVQEGKYEAAGIQPAIPPKATQRTSARLPSRRDPDAMAR